MLYEGIGNLYERLKVLTDLIGKGLVTCKCFSMMIHCESGGGIQLSIGQASAMVIFNQNITAEYHCLRSMITIHF